MHSLFSLLSAIVPVVAAQGPCVGLNCGSVGNPLPLFIVVGATIVLEIASGLAVLSVVIGGAYLVLNMANETNFEKGKKGIIFGLIAFALALSSQAIVSFVVSKAYTINVDSPVISLMSVTVGTMLTLLNVAFALMMLFFGFKLILARGQQAALDATKKGLTWAASGAVAINLSYALIRATYFLGF